MSHWRQKERVALVPPPPEHGRGVDGCGVGGKVLFYQVHIDRAKGHVSLCEDLSGVNTTRRTGSLVSEQHPTTVRTKKTVKQQDLSSLSSLIETTAHS